MSCGGRPRTRLLSESYHKRHGQRGRAVRSAGTAVNQRRGLPVHGLSPPRSRAVISDSLGPALSLSHSRGGRGLSASSARRRLTGELTAAAASSRGVAQGQALISALRPGQGPRTAGAGAGHSRAGYREKAFHPPAVVH